MRNYVLGLLFFLVNAHHAVACEPARVMALNWPSAQFLAELDYLVLSEGFQCDVELHPGTSRSAHHRLNDPGQSVLVPEYWMPPDAEPLHYQLLGQGPFDSAGAGFYIPATWLEQHEGNPTIESILLEHGDPAKPRSLIGCAQGWSCHVPVLQWFRALRVASMGWRLDVPHGRAEWLKQVGQSTDSEDLWIGYAIGPSPEMSQAGLVRLSQYLEFDYLHYTECYQDSKCANPKAQSLPPSEVVTAASNQWLSDHSNIQTYLSKRRFDRQQTDRWMLYLAEGFSPEQAAIEFLATESRWHEWVPESVRDRILDDFN